MRSDDFATKFGRKHLCMVDNIFKKIKKKIPLKYRKNLPQYFTEGA